MEHHFEITDADKYGIEKAIILYNLRYWILHNMANETNQHDGRTWTFNSAKAYGKLFTYMSEHKIYRALRELIEEGILIGGNYNKAGYDRTKWYAFIDEEPIKAILHQRKMDITPMANAFNEDAEPIPNINPDTKPNKNNYTSDFLNFWKEYPRNANKAGAFKMWKARLKEKVPPDLIMNCLTNYKKKLAIDGTEEKFTLHATTFLNKDHRFEDFSSEIQVERTGNYIDKNGNQFEEGVKTGHWDGSRFIPDMSRAK